MKSLWISVILIATFLLAGNSLSLAQTPEQLYQKGLMKEEGEGDLQEAIRKYTQITDNSEADQALRAKALLHIGMCYERMGTQEAVEAYQRLVTDFPTQKNEVAFARERLSSLVQTVELTQKDGKKPLSIRKVLPDTDIEPLGAVSPDGRHISYIDWKTGGNLGILNLKSNSRRVLTNFTEPDEQAYYSSWSPDGKQIAYFWWVYDKDQNNLSIVDVQSTKSRDLLISDKYDWIELGNWSSDGKSIFATLYLRDEQKNQIVRISTTDGSFEVLKTCEESYTGGKPYVSPDSRFVSFDLQGMDASGNNDIFILSLDNRKVSTLIKHPSHDYFLGWSPDARNILFATDRRGTVDAMLIAVQDGNPVGEPKPVKQNMGPVVPMGLTQDGSFFYGQWPGADNIFTAEIDIHEGKLLSESSLMIQKFAGSNYSPAYSSDGRYLAYISDRGVMKKGKPQPVLCIRNLETLEENEIIADPDILGGISTAQWSPDDRTITIACLNQDRHSRIYIYDIQTKKFSPLVQESKVQSPDIHYAYPIWSKDGNSLFYLQFGRYSTTTRLMARNISTGNEKELYSYTSDDFMDRLFNISLSPDGEWVATINRGVNRVVRLISTDGEEIKDLYSIRSPGGFPYSPIWSKDGKYIVFPHQNLKSSNYWSRKWGLMRISSEGGDSLLINMEVHGVASPTLHPNGHSLAFRSAGTSFPENNIWEMKNFLPLEQSPETMFAEEPEGIKIKQVWESPLLDDLGRVSYDGLYRSCVDWGNGDLAIHNLVDGEIRTLTQTASLGDTGSFVLTTAISKNGKQIVSSWWRPYNTTDLVLTNVENNSSDIIYSRKGEEVYPGPWLSDNVFVAFRYIPDQRTNQLVTYNTLTKSLQVKKTFDSTRGIHVVCSPDEKYIAYNTASNDKGGNMDIFLLTANGEGDIPLITHPANDRVFGWMPGGKEFLFLSDRSGTWDLWAVGLDGTKISGPAKRIYTDIGDVIPIGFTQNGKCYFGFVRRNFYTSIAPFNAETGEIDMGSGKSLKGSNYGLTWSPDGQYLSYLNFDDGRTPVILDLITGEERKPYDETLIPFGFSWSPDGNSFLLVGKEENQLRTEGYKGDIFLIDAKTGHPEKILKLSDYEFNVPVDDAFPLSDLEWSPDGKSFYYLLFRDRLVQHDLETGEDKILYKHSNFERFILRLSPDGQNLLFGLEYPGEKKSRLFTIPSEGGEKKEVCTSQEANRFSKAFWSPDGKNIYFAEILGSLNTNFWRVPSKGGNPEKVWSSENRVDIFDIHPDGNQIAFSIRERKTEVRVIENLTSELAKVFKE